MMSMRLVVGEHVLTAGDIEALGGHQSLDALRRLLIEQQGEDKGDEC
jgi:hypothetical protein